MSNAFKHLAVFAASAALLAACATQPKPINLPLSALDAPTESVKGSAIAFQANAGNCDQSGFQISPKLSDGKYGPAESIRFERGWLSFKSKGLNQKNFKSSGDQLYAKTMAPGDYAITRIWCTRTTGYQVSTYYTKPDRIDVFGNFTVDPGQTNYIGGLTVTKGYGAYPSFTIKDESTKGRDFFDEHYADKVGPLQVKLATSESPSAGAGDFSALLKAIIEAQKELEAKKAEDAKKAEETAPAE